MYVTPNGVSIVFRNGKMLDTGIIPANIHPGKAKLSPQEIEDFHKFIKFKDFEIGQLYSKQDFINIQNEYKKAVKSKMKPLK